MFLKCRCKALYLQQAQLRQRVLAGGFLGAVGEVRQRAIGGEIGVHAHHE
jgi:hypothetical protein